MSLRCKDCEGNCKELIVADDFNQKLDSKRFTYYRCKRDGLIFIDPIPPALGDYYPEQYYELPKSESDLNERAIRLQSWKINLVKKYFTEGNLLEIGPAYGLFAHLAKNAGFKVTGIEMDSRCCSYLRESVGIDVIESSDVHEVLVGLEKKYKVIVLWQVIEHLKEPWLILEKAAELLEEDGVIILDTPNPESFQFSLLGKYWTHLDAPRHLTLIPRQTLIKRASIIDLSTIEITASNTGANGFNGFGWAFSLKGFAKNPFLAGALHFIGRVIAKLLIPIERTGFRGSTYTVVLRKIAR